MLCYPAVAAVASAAPKWVGSGSWKTEAAVAAGCRHQASCFTSFASSIASWPFATAGSAQAGPGSSSFATASRPSAVASPAYSASTTSSTAAAEGTASSTASATTAASFASASVVLAFSAAWLPCAGPGSGRRTGLPLLKTAAGCTLAQIASSELLTGQAAATTKSLT